MSGIYGMNLKLSIFGESHGKSIGCVLDGLPPGIALDLEALQLELDRRAPGKNKLSTQRKESDMFEIQSGFFEGHTTGTPLCAIIKNSDQHSKDYSILKDKMRPGHADYAGFVRYQGFNDYRGGGHFSGRITAPLVFAGAVAKQALAQMGIIVGAHILSINNISENKFNPMGEPDDFLKEITGKEFAVMDDNVGEQMQARIIAAKADNDSVGGVIETIVQHIPAGVGAPYFDSLESRLAHMMFSVPAVKGIEFGEGFAISQMTGSAANDEMHYVDGQVKTTSNHNGGITGGITNSMPVLFRVAIKPTPSISKEQNTISLLECQDTKLTIVGRHDPCIVQRAVPVIEAATAWIIWDMLLEAKKWEK